MAARQSSTENLALEVLCDHHNFNEFDCGDGQINVALNHYLDNVAFNLDTFVVVLADPKSNVCAYIALVETFMSVRGELDSPYQGRYFFIPAVGVLKEFQGTNAFDRLLDHLTDVMARRMHDMSNLGRDVHLGVLCQTRGNAALARSLQRSGFIEFPGDPFYTVLFFDDPDTVDEGHA